MNAKSKGPDKGKKDGKELDFQQNTTASGKPAFKIPAEDVVIKVADGKRRSDK